MIGSSSALPPIDQSQLPADVRNGTTKDKQDYQAALGFERMLLGQMTQAMTATAQPVDDGSSTDGSDGSDSSGTGGTSTDAATSQYLSMLPGQLADSLISHGGLGLANDFYRAMKQGQQK